MGERKLKVADVTRAIDVHRNTITLLCYEKAKRIDFEVLDKLCKLFGCKVEDLLEVAPGTNLEIDKKVTLFGVELFNVSSLFKNVLKPIEKKFQCI